MKFVCQNPKCKKTFVYVAKLTSEINVNQDILEIHVCPYCHELEFEEYIEPVGKISSVKSVELAEVDSWIGQGYEVKELYAKTATMIKKEVPKA